MEKKVKKASEAIEEEKKTLDEEDKVDKEPKD
jgi:hypothetical protein